MDKTAIFLYNAYQYSGHFVDEALVILHPPELGGFARGKVCPHMWGILFVVPKSNNKR